MVPARLADCHPLEIDPVRGVHWDRQSRVPAVPVPHPSILKGLTPIAIIPRFGKQHTHPAGRPVGCYPAHKEVKGSFEEGHSRVGRLGSLAVCVLC
ncbi:hypothetical protein G6F16_001193 [Rhizopus arrhizus]|nr:hypothetical protein G6F23_000998 [Rhizopus arrhizus]KAG0795560.1 hypothetical protein G6F22_005088 [Rhizopus arrhizus]KAG0795991.1 hypothetical protein G6F21_001661 [Rhizopus arrhizus]KAG0819013.1 hypothetical protein G6F20_001091 [Rhizopus arrhizus]KAG0842388.1 hypothetical protein G6F19_001062 [Rhizopus arrhizus]